MPLAPIGPSLEHLKRLESTNPLLSWVELHLYQTGRWATPKQIIKELGLEGEIAEAELRAQLDEKTGAPLPHCVHLPFVATKHGQEVGFQSYRTIRGV